MMLGLAQPSGGNIRLRGFEVPKDIRKALSRVGGIVEEPRFYPYLSGRRNLDIWAAHYGGEARSRITSVLERVELTDRAGDKVKTYSLGMRQRLGVARALLNDPELLVLDEPTNGLDPAGMLEFRNMIRDLVEKEGRTVFISSHILDEVQKMADDIAIVQAGRLISWGPVDELIASGRHSVLLRTDDDERARGVLSGISFVTGVGRNEQYKALDLEVADISDERLIAINRTLVEAGVGVAEIWRREREPRGSLPRAHRRQQARRHDAREEGRRRCWQLRFAASPAGAARYWSALLIGLGAVVLMAIIRIYQDGDAGGTEFLDAMGPISLVATLMAVLVGALAGSYDTAQGTMRYLVMTGVPRRRLYATRVLGTALATIICCAPAIVVGIVAAYALRHSSFNDPTASSVLGAIWAYLVNPVVYALVSVGVGSLLRSNGAAIGVSLGFALGGGVITGLVNAYVSESLSGYLLTAAAPIVADLDRHAEIPLAAAFAALVAWVTLFVCAGLWRTLNDEY